MKNKMVVSIIVLLLGTIICNGQEKKNQEVYSFNTDSLLYHAKTLSSDSFEGRRTGTIGAEKAKNYIISQFKTLNVLPLIENYQQPFAFNWISNPYKGINILGFIKGTSYSDEYIVISAHYDHLGIKNNKIYNGADDNASGVSALFAFANYFQMHPPKHSVILAAFDAEELELIGSKYYVEHSVIPLEKIQLNINIDMISRNDKNELFVTGTIYNDHLKSIVANYLPSKKIRLLMGHDGKDGLENWTYSGDHQPFYLKKIPFLYFGVEDHKDYHQPTDDFENIQKEFYISAVQTIISIFQIIDNTEL